MFSNFFKREKKLKDVILGNGSLYLQCSDNYQTEQEEDGTTLIYPKGEETITLRFAIFDYNLTNQNQAIKTGYELVKEDAKENSSIIEYEDRAVNYSEESTIEDGTSLEMKYWKVGLRTNKLILISATILKSKHSYKIVKQILNSIEDIIKSIQPTTKEKTIQTDIGEVVYTSQIPKSNEEQKAKKDFINEVDRKNISKWIIDGTNMIRHYIPDFQNDELNFSTLDKVFELWINDSENKFDSNSIKNGLGAIFGRLLNQELEMRWIKVVDEYGEELAVEHKSSFKSFPFSSVDKRIKTSDTGFFQQIFEILKHEIK